MTRLKKEIQKKCYELLKDFVDTIKVPKDDVDLTEKIAEAQEALELLKHLNDKVKPDLTAAAGGACTYQAMGCPPSA